MILCTSHPDSIRTFLFVKYQIFSIGIINYDCSHHIEPRAGGVVWWSGQGIIHTLPSPEAGLWFSYFTFSRISHYLLNISYVFQQSHVFSIVMNRYRGMVWNRYHSTLVCAIFYTYRMRCVLCWVCCECTCRCSPPNTYMYMCVCFHTLNKNNVCCASCHLWTIGHFISTR